MANSSKFSINGDETIVVDGQILDQQTGAPPADVFIPSAAGQQPQQQPSSGSTLSQQGPNNKVGTKTSITYTVPPPTQTPCGHCGARNGDIPSAYNNDQMLEMKLRRKRRTVIFGIVGGVAGCIVLGPVGGIVGGFVGALGTRANGKRRERRKRQEIMDQRQQQGAAAASNTGSAPAEQDVAVPAYNATAV